jgi:hypothetical protein
MPSLECIPRIRALHGLIHLHHDIWGSIVSHDAFHDVTELSGVLDEYWTLDMPSYTPTLLVSLAKHMPRLERLKLTLKSGHFDRQFFDPLTTMKHLITFHLCVSHVTRFPLTLIQCPAFTSLHLRMIYSTPNLDSILEDELAVRLQYLRLTSHRAMIQWGTRLRMLTSLRSLSITDADCISLLELMQPDVAPALETLSLESFFKYIQRNTVALLPRKGDVRALLNARPTLTIHIQTNNTDIRCAWDDIRTEYPRRFVCVSVDECCPLF